MTRENYFAFKRALLHSGYVWNVTKKGKYITIEPYQNISFFTTNVLDTIFYEKHINYEIDGNGTIHTEYGSLEYICADHFNTQIYYTRYKIVD